MIIDCHVHPPERDLATTLRRADQCGIDRLCMFSLGNEAVPSAKMRQGFTITGAHYDDATNPPPGRITASNIRVQEMVEEFPDRLYSFCFVNPLHPEHALSEIRDRVENGPMQGIKLWVSCKANDPLVEPIAAYAIELEVPVLQHCWNKCEGNMPGESSTQDVAELARKFPALKIIAAHLPGQGEQGILDLAPYPNVYLDTSGMGPDVGILEFAKEIVGANRILFGSDAPVRSFGSALARVNGCILSMKERSAILGGNFQHLLAI